MLQKLSIRNYAIIDGLDIDFSAKLNIITGETGAGKSIIMGALGLILGERADTGVLVRKEKKCVVEGIFSIRDKVKAIGFLAQHELDAGDELVLRREIAASGKARAFVNDTPVNLSQLEQLGYLLVDLHQQFDTLQLADSDFQREVIDALAGNSGLLAGYQLVYQSWQSVNREVKQLLEQKQQFEKESDYNKFQYEELESLNLGENELENIDAELRLLNNAEEIKTALNKIYFELEENDTPIVQQLKSLAQQLLHYQSFHPGLPSLEERMQSLQIELKDIAAELSRVSDEIHYDAKRIETLNDRLSAGYRLLKKHSVKTTTELLSIQRGLEEKLQAVLGIDDLLRLKEAESQKLKDEAISLARKMSATRAKQVKPLEEKVNKLLGRVGMPNARLKVEISSDRELNTQGSDIIVFLFDANKSGQFQPIRKVASGGELSRLMLCIKSLVAESIDLPTMIFDEIDSGISGEAAKQVGIILKELAKKRQVICITHQPQIAGRGDAHFFVYKEMSGDKVQANIRRLDGEERITSIAKMLGGEKPTAAALENAREMVNG
jgi:DNA repair protein RecN (Recombination protein N)